jgi:hypothetical protein
MRIDQSGNVGIGTPTPGFKLDVADRIRLRNGAGGSAGLWLNNQSGGGDSDNAFIGLSDSSHVGFFGYGKGTGGAPNSAGNPAVGWGLLMDTTNGNLESRGTPPAIWWRLSSEPANYYAKSYLSPGGGGTSNPNDTHLGFQVHSWPSTAVVTPLVLTAAGNVGIGTLAPTSLLDVNNGWFHTTYNSYPYVPESNPGGGLTIGWNRSGGQAEVNFVNVFNNPTTAFMFSKKIANGTALAQSVDLMGIYGTGQVNVNGPFYAAGGYYTDTATAILKTHAVTISCASRGSSSSTWSPSEVSTYYTVYAANLTPSQTGFPAGKKVYDIKVIVVNSNVNYGGEYISTKQDASGYPYALYHAAGTNLAGNIECFIKSYTSEGLQSVRLLITYSD